MATYTSKWKKEWNRMLADEKAYLKQGRARKEPRLNSMVARHVPDGLQEKLDAAFAKAFKLIFEKGTGIIEKTYDREGIREQFDEARLSAHMRKGNGLRKVLWNARGSRAKNIVYSGIEGIGLGAAGIGLPDIPLFTGMLLKGIYEVALHFGYEYESEKEKYFILRIIEVALKHGSALDAENQALNEWIEEEKLPIGYDRDEQIERTSAAISKELLYMKFLQGLPIVGALGGAYDPVYMQKILSYAELKYHRRFLLEQGSDPDDGPIIA